jgi:hypothetical protein
MKGVRIYRDRELIMYAAMNTTIAIFHRGGGGGWPSVFKFGSVNHVSRPVDVT